MFVVMNEKAVDQGCPHLTTKTPVAFQKNKNAYLTYYFYTS